MSVDKTAALAALGLFSFATIAWADATDPCVKKGIPKELKTSKITHYYSATDRKQHQRGEGAPWKGTGKTPLVACKTVAVDPSVYPHGTVFYIPAIVGMKCKNKDGSESVSDGIVRAVDTGDDIKGAGRFDFFIGGCDSVNKQASECNDNIESWRKIQKRLADDKGVSFCVLKKGANDKGTDYSSSIGAYE